VSYRIEHDEPSRESFGNHRYCIYEDGRLIAHYWHDFRRDEHGIEFVSGKSERWPVGLMTEFLEGGGPEPLTLSVRAVAYSEAETLMKCHHTPRTPSQRPNPRLQRTPLRAPLSRKPLGDHGTDVS